MIVELKEENDFRLTAEELEAVITPKTKILIMPFPNNPTGAIMEKADLEAIVQVVKEHDLFVIKITKVKIHTMLQRQRTKERLQLWHVLRYPEICIMERVRLKRSKRLKASAR